MEVCCLELPETYSCFQVVLCQFSGRVCVLQSEFVAECFNFALSFSNLALTDTEVGLVTSLLLTSSGQCLLLTSFYCRH